MQCNAAGQGVPQGPGEGAEASKLAGCEANCPYHRPVRLSGARLLKRVFELDLEHSSNCGGEQKIIAAMLGAGSPERSQLGGVRPLAAPGRRLAPEAVRAPATPGA